jgi:hypothetical protein
MSTEEQNPFNDAAETRTQDAVVGEESSTVTHKPTVILEANPFKDLSAEPGIRVRDWVFPVPMETTTVESLDRLIRDYALEAEANMSESAARSAVQAYADHLRQTYLGHWRHGQYANLFTREGAEFVQAIDSDKGPIRIGGQNVALGNSQAMSGPSAIMAIQNALGIGKPTKVPCWSSGLVLTLGNFKTSEILSLNLALTETRAEIGYETGGMLFSGGDVNIISEVVDFILDHVIATNIRGWMVGDKAVLKKLLKVMDIPSLLAGALASIYPSGYPTVHKCKNTGTAKCDYNPALEVDIDGIEFKVDSLLDFKKVVWTDRTRVSPKARRFMSSGNNVHTVEQIEEYQDEFNTLEPLSAPLSDSGAIVKIAFHQPNLETYERVGRLWINGVMEMVNMAMDRITDADRETRRTKRISFIRNYQHALRLQKHAAWIKNLQMHVPGEDEPRIVSDTDTLFSSLETLAEDKALAKNIIEAVDKHRVDAQVTFTGIPNYVCPSCNEPQLDPAEAEHGLIPMDMVAYFFTIMVWKWEHEATISTNP